MVQKAQLAAAMRMQNQGGYEYFAPKANEVMNLDHVERDNRGRGRSRDTSNSRAQFQNP